MTVTPVTKQQIQFVTSLHHAKFREKFNKFIVEGEKICTECLSQYPGLIFSIFALPEWINKNKSKIQEWAVYEVNEHTLAKLSCLKTPNQVLMVCHKIQESSVQPISHLGFYLDRIQDPGNLGTIIRLVDWFGLYPLWLSPFCVELFNPKVVQASMGSILGINYKQIDLGELIHAQPKLTVYGADLQGQNLQTIKFQTPGLVIIGSESNGISSDSRQYVQNYLQIPKNKTAVAESLNAATAAAIFAFQMSLTLRQ